MNNLLTPRRLGALAGVAFIVAFIVGVAVEGKEPSLTATAAKITSHYTSHHSKVLVADVLISVAFILFIMWAAVLAGELRAAGRHAGAGALLAAITGGATLAVAASAVEVGLDQAAIRSTDPGFMHGGYLVDEYLGGALPFLFLAAAAAATALASGGLFSPWYRWLTGLIGVLVILGGISVKASGFFSPTGGAATIALVALGVWVLATSVVLWRVPRATVSAQSVGATLPGQAVSV